jgi:DNA-directed RNA polymerase specialized sigma24 family protein
MPTVVEGSVTHWIDDLKAGDDAAARRLWERYYDRIVRLARTRLRGVGRRGLEADEEDAALSAFDSLCRGAARGQFPQLSDRDDLWKLLVVLTVRKALNQIEHQSAQKRGGGRVVRETDLPPAGADDGGNGLDHFAGREPTPEFAAMMADEYQRAREGLGEDSLRLVFDLRLEGFTREEIAARLGCAVRTVTRKLEMIRSALEGEEP